MENCHRTQIHCIPCHLAWMCDCTSRKINAIINNQMIYFIMQFSIFRLLRHALTTSENCWKIRKNDSNARSKNIHQNVYCRLQEEWIGDQLNSSMDDWATLIYRQQQSTTVYNSQQQSTAIKTTFNRKNPFNLGKFN